MGLPSDETESVRLWDENAALWTAEVRAGQDRFRDVFNNPMFLGFVPDLAELEVLDAGCGEGHNTRLFARRGAKMTGVDFSSRFIDAAEAQEKAEPLGIRYLVCSFADLAPFAASSFDAIISTMAFMSTPDFGEAAREIHRVLRKGGGLYFSVTHPCFMTRGSQCVSDEAGRETGRLISNYWDEPFIERWGFRQGTGQMGDVFTIRYFAYRFEDYVNGLSDAGFRITKIAEPRPTEAMLSEYPPLKPFRDHVPIFLYVAAAK